jgi:hypothetical protein
MTPPGWLTLIVAAVPLFGIAGSAVAYVVKLYLDSAERRRKRFFELLGHIDGQGPIAAKLGAVYALRHYKEHREFIKRFCESQMNQVVGENAKSLVDEFKRTAAAVERG